MPRVSFFFCEQCNVLQPAQPGADYFLLLDMCPPPPPLFPAPHGIKIHRIRLPYIYLLALLIVSWLVTGRRISPGADGFFSGQHISEI